jgi:transcriptional regulator with XRE-family HTH domain
VTETLAAVETARERQGLSRHQLADRLGIPFDTFRRWFHKTAPKQPSAAHLSRLEAYVTKAPTEVSEWDGVWQAIRGWWQTQHRYASVSDLARDIGWESDDLQRCFREGVTPPRLVLERLADELRIPTPKSPPRISDARTRTERLRALLILLHEELAWFRDGPEEVRAILRSELDSFDLGYLSSLLAMLPDEAKFRLWLIVTTNRFASFQRKGERK